jgi:hypothetical protein
LIIPSSPNCECTFNSESLNEGGWRFFATRLTLSRERPSGPAPRLDRCEPQVQRRI